MHVRFIHTARLVVLVNLTVLPAVVNLIAGPASAANATQPAPAFAAVGVTSRAIKITEALNDSTGLVIRGTIKNNFSPTQSAGCSSSSFLLVGNGNVYQGVAQCD